MDTPNNNTPVERVKNCAKNRLLIVGSEQCKTKQKLPKCATTVKKVTPEGANTGLKLGAEYFADCREFGVREQ